VPARFSIFIVAALACGLALAHPEDDKAAPHAVIDCEHPAPGTATELPAEIADIAYLQCTPAMQMLVANEGWSWRYPGSFFDRPFIPAYAPEASQGTGGARYFSGFSTRDLSADEVRERHAQFARTLPNYRQDAAPERIVMLEAKNDLGHVVDAYFGFRSGDSGWVVMCTPQCAPENMFLIQKIQ
jgi:hypothetical protein